MDDVKNTPEAEENEMPAEEKTEKKKTKKPETELRELKKQVEAAEEAAKAANDKYLRMMAEYDNFRKRSAKEKERKRSHEVRMSLRLYL